MYNPFFRLSVLCFQLTLIGLSTLARADLLISEVSPHPRFPDDQLTTYLSVKDCLVTTYDQISDPKGKTSFKEYSLKMIPTSLISGPSIRIEDQISTYVLNLADRHSLSFSSPQKVSQAQQALSNEIDACEGRDTITPLRLRIQNSMNEFVEKTLHQPSIPWESTGDLYWTSIRENIVESIRIRETYHIFFQPSLLPNREPTREIGALEFWDLQKFLGSFDSVEGNLLEMEEDLKNRFETKLQSNPGKSQMQLKAQAFLEMMNEGEELAGFEPVFWMKNKLYSTDEFADILHGQALFHDTGFLNTPHGAETHRIQFHLITREWNKNPPSEDRAPLPTVYATASEWLPEELVGIKSEVSGEMIWDLVFDGNLDNFTNPNYLRPYILNHPRLPHLAEVLKDERVFSNKK